MHAAGLTQAFCFFQEFLSLCRERIGPADQIGGEVIDDMGYGQHVAVGKIL